MRDLVSKIQFKKKKKHAIPLAQFLAYGKNTIKFAVIKLL